MNPIIETLGKFGVVPVIKIDKIENAVPLAKALCAGGLPVAELTFRTECAGAAMKLISKEVPEMLVGAGTVLTTEKVDEAIEAGAKFIVSPGLNPKIVNYCKSKNIPILPGCSNASDIEVAIELGLSVIKFFPAEQLGGINMIKALAAPYTQIKFMPTGGVNQNNINAYLEYDKIVACGGSWMVKDDLINSGQFDKITELTKEAINTVLGFSFAHVGINSTDETQATNTANKFAMLFGKTTKVGNSAIFVDKDIEVRKSKYLGKNGHIAIKTKSIKRAMHYLSDVNFNMESAIYDEKNNIKAIYLSDEIGDFAVHLVE